ncbi:MurR/RpiR family transcriptional regulator [Aerococcus mictus]|uniref:MurR/RpiR family transcriptional regulator n=1 Tax=Aerococcus mictus TaxID=2976810 RepID=UPI002279A201|nr:MurR/RpiR family transcriptional regulator [Aerococcus mictus]MCY3089568.1 MurR/RpiR family transcriptional regulator [Aerococcus mictus]
MKNLAFRKRIKTHLQHLSQTEKKIATFLTTHSNEQLLNMTISELAKKIGVSQSSVFQFVKKLNFKGFQEFKYFVAQNIEEDKTINDQDILNQHKISNSDSPLEVGKKVIAANVFNLKNALDTVEENQLDHIIKLIKQSKTLHFFGQGGSNIVALDGYHKFIHSSFSCNYIFDYNMQLVYSMKLSSKDCVFLFSHSGKTPETLNIAKHCRKQGANIVVMTSNPDSDLIALANESLIIYIEDSLYRNEYLSSRVVYSTLLDILYVNIIADNAKEEKNTIDRSLKIINDAKNN